MKNLHIVFFILFAGVLNGQELVPDEKKHQGELSFGVRSTESLFSASGSYFGIGAGWQVRYRMSNHFNTEWFSDWITTDLGGMGQRFDAHIGESMIIYPGKRVGEKNRFTPYVMGGFCGDYTKIQTNTYYDHHENIYKKDSKDRWSFATQLGLGTHYNITERFDLSFSTQYVLHFGADIHTEVETNDHGEEYMHIHEESGEGLEGHFFVTLSANFVVFNLKKANR